MMAYLALGLLTLTGAGLIYFLYYDRSMSSLKNRQRTLSAELSADEEALADFEKNKPMLDASKRLSLPADINMSSNKYGEELERMLAASHFPADKISLVKPKMQADAPKAPGASRQQKPVFTRVLYDLQVHGDLTMLTDFLERFYRAPLLHRIKSLQVARPTTRTPDQMAGELDILMTVEALVMDAAENRKTLLPDKLKDSEKPRKLARSTAQYDAIADNNHFFGPPPEQREDPTRGKPDFNILPEIVFDGVWTDSTGTWATLFDAADDYQYQIRKSFDGKYRVDRFFFIKDTKKKDYGMVGVEKLELRDAKNYLHRSYTILRVDSQDIYLENAGTVYQWHAGSRASEVKALSRDEAAKLGLKVKEEKKDDKGKSTGEDKKVSKEGPKSEGEKVDEGR
jgi:hypothetical protein